MRCIAPSFKQMPSIVEIDQIDSVGRALTIAPALPGKAHPRRGGGWMLPDFPDLIVRE
jgi:hypothetical protein